VIQAGCWQAARSGGAWGFVTCSVSPGFDFVDLELLGDGPPPLHLAGALEDLLEGGTHRPPI
jgi:predicted cupin superfamily sugar epimerase